MLRLHVVAHRHEFAVGVEKKREVHIIAQPLSFNGDASQLINQTQGIGSCLWKQLLEALVKKPIFVWNRGHGPGETVFEIADGTRLLLQRHQIHQFRIHNAIVPQQAEFRQPPGTVGPYQFV